MKVSRMTNEEAVMVLNMVEAHGLADEAKKMAISALEKQIPKKPLIRYENMGFGSPCETFKIYGCPCCREELDEATSFCQNCGQKIDWSEGDDLNE